ILFYFFCSLKTKEKNEANINYMVVASFICQNKWRGVAILYDKIVKTAGNPPAVFFIINTKI
ncbi:hypothetical protein, partial [Odoribacter laneus]|uniref:hypothetical protein n=1 Tax=Odoribacter laneus TaxID=626933 RepID=UPI003AAFE89D